MSDWTITEADGVVYHLHDELGTIIETKEGFVFCTAKLFKIGPTSNLEQAKEWAVKTKELLPQYEDRLNLELVK